MVFLVLLIPIGVLGFALSMERIEHRLHTGSVSEQDVEEFLDNARPEEMTTFVKEGWTRALSRFRVRNRANRPSRRARKQAAARAAAALGSAGRGAGATAGSAAGSVATPSAGPRSDGSAP